MPDRDGKPTIEDLLKDIEENPAVTAEDVPDFIIEARRYAEEQGIAPDVVFQQKAFEALRHATYPTPQCILPYELEYAGALKLTPEREAHLKECIPCRRLVRTATHRPYVAPSLPIPAGNPVPVGAGAGGTSVAGAAEPVPWWVPLRGWLPAAVPAAGLTAIALAVFVGSGILPGPSQPAVASIAVLPTFSAPPTDATPQLAALAQGLSESMAVRLSKITSLHVIGPETATAQALATTLETVPGETGINRLFSTQLAEDNTGLTVTARLIDVSTGDAVWTRSYATNRVQLASFNATLASDVSRELGLTRFARRLVGKVDTANSRSYLSYLRGRAAWARRDKQGFEEAIALYEAALKDDPKFALARAGLSDAYLLQGAYNYERRAEVYPKAEAEAKRALALEPELAEAYTSLALANLYQRKYSDAEKGFREAIRLNPSYSSAHRWYANLLTGFERFDEARTHIDEAVGLDPLSLNTRTWKAVMLLVERKTDEATTYLRALLDKGSVYVGPRWQVHLTLGQALEQARDVTAAIGQLETARSQSKNDALVLGALGQAYARAGRREEALALLNQILSQENHSETAVAFIYAALGDKDHAFQSLENAYERFDNDLLFLRVDPAFDDLRGDPRFDSLVARMGLARSTT